MGCCLNIDLEKKPKQGTWVGRRVEVSYNYDPSKTEQGKIIRDDSEHPGETIILLDSGFPIRATECQFHPIE